MKVFLDANVLVSVLNKEYPVFTYASKILSFSEHKNVKFYTSPLCLAIAFYFSEKKSGAVMAKSKIDLLVSKIHIADSTKKTVLQSLKDKSVIDFEDGMQYYSAKEAGCEYIVTEDVGDFFFSELPVQSCEVFLELLRKTGSN